MAEHKVACPQCGQHVSGDDAHVGTTVQCPICSTQFPFHPLQGTGAPPLPAATTATAAADQYFNVPQGPSRPPSDKVVRQNSLATTSMVLGIVGLVAAFCLFGGLGIPGVLAVILGVVALLQIGRSNGAMMGKGKAITGIVLGAISGIFGLTIGLAMFSGLRNSTDALESPFRQAERLIMSDSDGKIAHGNNAQAEELASRFATQMKEIRDVAIEGDDSSFSLSGNNFLTYCQLNDDSAAFMVHVPDLRNYEDDAKEFIANTAWAVAQSLLVDTALPDGSRLGVGTKGVLLFDKVYLGRHLKSFADEDSEETGLTNREGEEGDLEVFFPKPDPQPEAPEEPGG